MSHIYLLFVQRASERSVTSFMCCQVCHKEHLSISVSLSVYACSLKKSSVNHVVLSYCIHMQTATPRLTLSYISRPPLSLSIMTFHLRRVCMPRCNYSKIAKNKKILIHVQ